MEKEREYTVQFSQENKSTAKVYKCNAIYFKNAGTVDVYINNHLLPAASATVAAGEMAINGQPNEIDLTKYTIQFAGGVTTGLLYVRAKIYK